MTTFLLVRHGDTGAIGKCLAGWTPGWRLNEQGKQQVRLLAQKLSELPIKAVYTSPLERAIETAEAVAGPHGLTVIIRSRLGEFRFGAWEGKTFEELEFDPQWQRFNTSRSVVRPPGGELMIEVQARMIAEIEDIRREHPDETVAVIGHGDPLRSVIAHYLGAPIDLILRFEISPASVSIVRIFDDGPRVLCLNHTGYLPQ